MNIASNAIASACAQDDVIPCDYTELWRDYAKFVANLLRKYNKVGRNHEEVLSHNWEKLVQSRMLEKYRAFVTEKMPKTMTAVEACSFLGISFGQWRTAMWAFHMGDPIYNKDKIEVRRRRGHWMPTPLNAEAFLAKSGGKSNGYSAKTAILDTDDLILLTVNEKLMKNGSVRGPFFKQGPLNVPGIKVTKGHFSSYLAKCVHNNFMNWLRTKARKHQERPHDTFAEFRGYGDNPVAWEATIEDPHGARQEARTACSEALRKLSESLHQSMEGVPSCKPVAEHETEMFDLLEQGIPLQDVMRKLDLPDRVRRAVLNSIKDRRPQAMI